MTDIADKLDDTFYFRMHHRDEVFEIFPQFNFSQGQTLDVIFVPGGGLKDDGTPQPWVEARLDAALDYVAKTRIIMTLSKGTAHKPRVMVDGIPIYEAEAGKKYLQDKGIPEGKIFARAESLDTLGEAYSARSITDLSDLRKMLVPTSAFHIPKARLVFDWVFSLPPNNGYSLHYLPTPNIGLTQETLDARRAWESERIQYLRNLMKEITTLSQLKDYLSSPRYTDRSAIANPPGIILSSF